MDMVELLLSYGFDTLQYSWVKATIDICMLADILWIKNTNKLFGAITEEAN
jgi:hypothetical protein